MNTTSDESVEFDDDFTEDDEPIAGGSNAVSAVVQGTDWTVETVAVQMQRGNIDLKPRFQRRDAWKRSRKSRFIESLIVGLPIPQIVLAESKTSRGKFIILDGKQRLLSILQYWGFGEGPDNAFPLSSLTLRQDLTHRTLADLRSNPDLDSDYAALCNQPIRTVVIRNWSSSDFLETVFLRLNTGSVSLSSQELRQALLPGRFTDFIDEAAGNSAGVRQLLKLSQPDSRMRDVEILARFLAFSFFAPQYPGRMKKFLDDAFGTLNDKWNDYRPKVEKAIVQFEKGVAALTKIFDDRIARKPKSSQFNRAIFDALIYYHAQPAVLAACVGKRAAIRKSYDALFADGSEFSTAIESDTAGEPNTSTRLRVWGAELSKITRKKFPAPEVGSQAAAKIGPTSKARARAAAKASANGRKPASSRSRRSTRA